jgi:hypothetical protein
MAKNEPQKTADGVVITPGMVLYRARQNGEVDARTVVLAVENDEGELMHIGEGAYASKEAALAAKGIKPTT